MWRESPRPPQTPLFSPKHNPGPGPGFLLDDEPTGSRVRVEGDSTVVGFVISLLPPFRFSCLRWLQCPSHHRHGDGGQVPGGAGGGRWLSRAWA